MSCLSNVLKACILLVVLSGATGLYAQRTATPHLITFFVERQTEEDQTETKQGDVIRKITLPTDESKIYQEKSLFNQTVDGLYATYLGWTSLSDKNGQIIFPRKHDDNRVTVVVTRSIQPVMSEETLIDHWVAGFDEPVVFYDFQLNQDPETKALQWDVKRIPTPPTRIIPLYAVVIIASPDQLTIQEGSFPALKGGNLIMPTLYANSQFDPGMNAIHFLKINRYFAPVELAKRYGTTQYAEVVIS